MGHLHHVSFIITFKMILSPISAYTDSVLSQHDKNLSNGFDHVMGFITTFLH